MTNPRLRRMINEAVSNVLKQYSINESNGKPHSLYNIMADNQEMKSKMKEVAKFIDLLEGVARMEGRDEGARFLRQVYSDLQGVIGWWGVNDFDDDYDNY